MVSLLLDEYYKSIHGGSFIPAGLRHRFTQKQVVFTLLY